MSNLSLNTNNATPFNNSISVVSNSTVQTMSSKDLLEVINQVRQDLGETKIRLNDFNNRIADELENDNYETFVVQNFNGTESIHYRLTEEQCMLVAMRESKLVRRTVLNKLKMLKPRTPQTYKEALQFLIEAEEQKEQLALQVAQQQKVIEIQAPKAEIFDAVLDKSRTYSIRDFAQRTGVKEKEVKKWLIEKHWMNGTSSATYRPASWSNVHNLMRMIKQGKTFFDAFGVPHYNERIEFTQDGFNEAVRKMVKSGMMKPLAEEA